MSGTVVDVSVWVPELATRVAGAPNATLRQELAATLREFYVKSGSWVVTTKPFDLVAQQATYRIPSQAQGNILYTYAVLVDERPVRFFGTETPGTITLRDAPSQSKADALTAAVAIRPRQYDTVPTITETYDFDTILDGAAGRLFNMPDKPWTNPNQARTSLQRFRSGMGQARVRTRGLYTKADVRYRFPPWS